MINKQAGTVMFSDTGPSPVEVSKEFQFSQEVHTEILDNIKDGIALWDTDDKMITCNTRFQAMFFEIKDILQPGVQYEAFITAACEKQIFRAVGLDMAIPIAQRMDRHKCEAFPFEERLYDGRWIHVLERKTSQQRIVSIFSDITEQKQSQDVVKNMIETDSLTGLYNRTMFNEHLMRVFEHSKNSSKMFAILVMDIDFFKSINDTMGHQTGDALLNEVAIRLRRCSRSTDIIARLGGDEFAIIAPDIGDPTDVNFMASRIISALAEIYQLEAANVHASASMGIAVYPVHNTSPDDLVRNADIALYKAKEEGRNQYKCYDETLHNEAQKHRKIEIELQQAVKENQLELFYQPQIDITTGKTIGAEALIRWNHLELGMVSPGDFIPIAESTNLMPRLGQWVIKTACKQAMKWQNDGLPSIVMAVNISPSQFKQHDLPDFIANVLAQTQLDPKWLEIEVTEEVAMEPDCQHQFEKLKEIGVNIAIDDFGTGYSSLSQLINFTIDRLKIDRSFVTLIDQHADRRAIFSAIVKIAKSLNFDVIAEGVETHEELLAVRALGCNEVQGFLFSKALPAIEFEKFLTAPPPITCCETRAPDVQAEPMISKSINL